MSKQVHDNSVPQVLSIVHRVAMTLRERIQSGQYALGDRLPTERELAESFGASRGTIRQSLALLEAERLAVRHQGRGTFAVNAKHARHQAGVSTLLGLLVYEREYFFNPVIQAASIEAGRHGYVLATGINSSAEAEREHLEAFLGNRARGLIMVPREPYSRATYMRLRRDGLPIVMLDNVLAGVAEDYVTMDSAGGTSLAVEHLAELGHRHLAYLGHNKAGDNPCRPMRKAGFIEGCEARGILLPPDFVIETDLDSVATRLAPLLRRPDRPTGLVCYNDAWAVAAMRAARELALRIPNDLSVVGFDDSFMAERADPPLTSVNPEHRELGAAAVRLLIEKIEQPRRRPAVGILINPSLAARTSTGKVPLTLP